MIKGVEAKYFVSYIIAFLFLFLVLFKIIPGEPVWDEAYFLGETLVNISLLERGEFSGLLGSEMKASIFTFLGGVIGIVFSSEEGDFHFITLIIFFTILVFSTYKVLNLFFDYKKSILLSSFILTLPEALNAYPLYMRDIPFAASSLLSLYLAIISKNNINIFRVICLSISVFVCLTLRPVFGVIYFFIPIMIWIYPQIKYKKSSILALLALLGAFLLRSTQIISEMRPDLIALDIFSWINEPNIQVSIILGVLGLSTYLYFKKENRIFLGITLFPLLGYWLFLKGKLKLLYIFVLGAIFSGFAKDLKVFAIGGNDLFQKVVQALISFQFWYFTLLILGTVLILMRDKNLVKRFLLSFIISLLIVFHLLQPAHDFRQFIPLYMISYIFLFVVIYKSKYEYLISSKFLSILIAINFTLFGLNYGSIFRVEGNSHNVFSKIIEGMGENLIEENSFITMIPFDKRLVDPYLLRYLAIKNKKRWKFHFNGTEYKHILPDGKKLNSLAFSNWEGASRYFLMGPIKNGNIYGFSGEGVADKNDQEVLLIERSLLVNRLIEDELERRTYLDVVKRFSVEGYGDYVLFKSLI